MTHIRAKNTKSRPLRHVLCVYPYRRELKELGFLPPLGLEYIAAVIENYTAGLDIVDLRRESGHTTDFIRPDTDLVCFSVNWSRETDFIASEIRSVNPRITTIVGGRYATEQPDKWLDLLPNIDAVVRSEGEEIVRDICRQKDWSSIHGLSYRDSHGVQHNPNRDPGPIQDQIQPSRHLRRYRYDLLLKTCHTGLGVDLITSSRGCPFNCTFCSFNRNPWGVKRNWNARPPESVVDELELMRAPVVAFTDDLFTHDMSRVEKICDLILKRGIKKKYIINARLEIAKHPRIIHKMESAGFAVLLLGIESAQDKTLKAMRKGFTTKEIRRYCETLKGTNMLKHGYFILGNIGEGEEEMLQIAPFAKDIGMDSISLSTLRNSPYSGLEELVSQTPGYYISSKGKIYSDHCSLGRLRQLRRQINKEFYSTGQVLGLLNKFRKHGALRLAPIILWGLGSSAGRYIGRCCFGAIATKKPQKSGCA